MPVSDPPLALKDPFAAAAWRSMQMSSRMHKGLARNAKQAGDEALYRYHHGYEEGLLKAMKVIVEKFK